MKLYCRIEKTIIEEEENLVIKEGPCSLPQNTSNVSNLNLLDDETLKVLGWVPVETQSDKNPIFVSKSYEVFEDKVIEKIINRDKSAEEIELEKEEQYYYLWQEIRQKRNQLLDESDKLIVIDRWENLSLPERQKLATYRQLLRDLPSQNSNPTLIEFPVL